MRYKEHFDTMSDQDIMQTYLDLKKQCNTKCGDKEQSREARRELELRSFVFSEIDAYIHMYREHLLPEDSKKGKDKPTKKSTYATFSTSYASGWDTFAEMLRRRDPNGTQEAPREEPVHNRTYIPADGRGIDFADLRIVLEPFQAATPAEPEEDPFENPFE